MTEMHTPAEWEAHRQQAAAARRYSNPALDVPDDPDITPEEIRRNQRATPSPDGVPQPVHERDRVNQWWYMNHVPRDSEHAHLFHLPPPYKLAGPVPDREHYHVAAVHEAARWAKLVATPLPGLVLDLSGPLGVIDRFFVTFDEADTGQHLFAEASGAGWVFNARECGGRLAALVAFRAHLRQLNAPRKAR